MANDADDIINFSVPSIDGVKINRYTVWNAGNFTNLNQLTTRNFSDIQNKPTTLSGYGITDSIARDDRRSGNIIANNINYSVYGFGYQADGFPVDGSFISFGGLNNRYVTQIQGSYFGAGMYYRTRNDDNGTWNSWHTILDDVNAYTKTSADNTFLKLAGGTLTGQLTLSIAGLTADNFIKFKNDTQNCYLGVRNSYGAYGLTFVSPDGTYNKVWHSGNDGVGSGLDADLLDGLQYYKLTYRNIFDYRNGLLVTTEIASNTDQMFIVKIIGNSYSYDSKSIDTTVQFYNYESGNAILSYGATNNAHNFGMMKLIAMLGVQGRHAPAGFRAKP